MSKILATIFPNLLAAIVIRHACNYNLPKCWQLECLHLRTIIFSEVLRIIIFQRTSNQMFRNAGNYEFPTFEQFHAPECQQLLFFERPAFMISNMLAVLFPET